jgi:hypothetical protein
VLLMTHQGMALQGCHTEPLLHSLVLCCLCQLSHVGPES